MVAVNNVVTFVWVVDLPIGHTQTLIDEMFRLPHEMFRLRPLHFLDPTLDQMTYQMHRWIDGLMDQMTAHHVVTEASGHTHNELDERFRPPHHVFTETGNRADNRTETGDPTGNRTSPIPTNMEESYIFDGFDRSATRIPHYPRRGSLPDGDSVPDVTDPATTLPSHVDNSDYEEVDLPELVSDSDSESEDEHNITLEEHT